MRPPAARAFAHDRQHFELKLGYEPAPDDLIAKYSVELFFCLPSSLYVSAESYPRQEFYGDVHNYVHLEVPDLDFDEILFSSKSPLLKLEEAISSASAEPSDLVYLSKLLGCILRSALRRRERRVVEYCAALRKAPEDSGLSQLADEQIVDFISSAPQILKRFRAFLSQVVTTTGADASTIAQLTMLDEFISVSFEEAAQRIVIALSGIAELEVAKRLRSETGTKANQEANYRRAQSYRSVLDRGSDAEDYFTHVRSLKRFAQDILFLAVRRKPAGRRWEEAALALAAVATTLVLLAQLRFSPLSATFFVLVVAGYMMKDRLKEALRKTFSAKLRPFIFDRRTEIIDPVNNSRLGICKEKVDYDVQLPSDVLQARDQATFAAEREVPETVIYYEKNIELVSDLLPQIIGTTTGITDILRFNLGRLLRQMDDPDQAFEYVDLEDFSIEQIAAPKTYPVDVFLRFAVHGGRGSSVTSKLIRLVLDRNGIKRVAQLPHSKEPTVSLPQAGAEMFP